MTGPPLASDELERRRRRLRFRSWHRGIREMDLIMGRFADACLSDLSGAELDEYERLMLVSDAELWAWIIGAADVPPRYDFAVLRRLREFSRDAGGAC
jgi:antitoxin CptB